MAEEGGGELCAGRRREVAFYGGGLFEGGVEEGVLDRDRGLVGVYVIEKKGLAMVGYCEARDELYVCYLK